MQAICQKCGKKRNCRNSWTLKAGFQRLCVKCNKSLASDWYKEHRQYKCAYMVLYRLKRKGLSKKELNMLKQEYKKGKG